MLIAHFCHRWRRCGRAPAEAVRDAQRWLRDTTNAEKAAWFAERRGEWADDGAAAAAHAL
jgi:hypothetical protein